MRSALCLLVLLGASGCGSRADWTLDDWEAHWAEQAERGDDKAAAELASDRFMDGEHAAAVAAFERLAETTDDPHVFTMLAYAHREGKGVAVDYERSAYWLGRAAEAGDEGAARDLAAYRAHVGRSEPAP